MNEKDKYENIWTNPRYRNFSFEERLYDKTLQYLEPVKDDCVAIYGIGCGRGPHKLRQEVGCKVIGIDIAHNCLDEGVEIDEFHVTNLWEPLPIQHCTAGIRMDVMEHIPSEHTIEVLQNIKDTSDRQIFRIPNHKSVWNGMPVHLTNRPEPWWDEQLSLIFSEVRRVEEITWVTRS